LGALTGTLTTTVAQDGIAKSIDYQFPAANLPTAAANWQTASTDILSDITTWKRVAAQASGIVPKEAYFNGTTAEAFQKNTAIRALLTDTQNGRGTKKEMLETGFIGHVNGIDFYQTDDQYINASGTAVDVIADNKLIMVPGAEDRARTCGLQVGDQLVPNRQGTESSRVRGRFSYSQLQSDPVREEIHSGMNALPVITVPGAFIYATTTP